MFRFNKNCKQPNFKCVLLITSQSLQPFIYKGCYMKFDLKQTCFIVLEQTGRPRVAYIVKTEIHFDLRASCTMALE